MNKLAWHQEMAEILKIALILVTGVLVIPLVLGFFHNISLIHILGLVGSILILQPFAVVVGFGLGINPFPMMLIMCSIGLSVIFVLFGICDMFAHRSEWLCQQLEKIGAITQKSELFGKYGIVTLIPFIWVPGVGLYGCVLIAWLFKWRGTLAVTILFAAWVLATLVVLVASIGILAVIQ
jgi:uncharacterized membrane protein